MSLFICSLRQQTRGTAAGMRRRIFYTPRNNRGPLASAAAAERIISARLALRIDRQALADKIGGFL